MNAPATAPDGPATPAGGRARRRILWLQHRAVTSAAAVSRAAVRLRDALLRRSATSAAVASEKAPGEVTDGADAPPRWGVVAVATSLAGGVLATRLGPAHALYWYAFPLFGVGIAYVLQFRSELSTRWWAVLAVSAVVSAVALARDWAFSGHVLWNVLFLGHAAQSPARRTWIAVLVASLVHLFAMKVAFQRPKDVVGGLVSVGVALVALPLAGRRTSRRAAVSLVV